MKPCRHNRQERSCGILRFSPVIALLLIFVAIPATAHNGAVALVEPLSGIAVDGDLADWPDDLRRYPIARWEYGVPPGDAADIEASFRLGYSAAEHALYIAVEVVDESIVSLGEGGGWDDQDGCDIYLDLAHRTKDAYGRQYVLWGDRPDIYVSGGPMGDPAELQVAVKRTAAMHHYEWRLDLNAISRKNLQLNPEAIFGLDIVVMDQDADGSYSWVTWGRGTQKISDPYRRGDAILVGAETALGWMRGRVQWDGTGVKRGRAMLRSTDAEDQWIGVVADTGGRFAVEVPVGRYRAQAAGNREAAPIVEVRVEAGVEEQVELPLPPPRGQSGSGKGHSVPIGSGGIR
jgi:hypothetical protein